MEGINPAYLHGDAAASRYLGLTDKRGRLLRKLAKQTGVTPKRAGKTAIWRITDLDRIFDRLAEDNRTKN